MPEKRKLATGTTPHPSRLSVAENAVERVGKATGKAFDWATAPPILYMERRLRGYRCSQREYRVLVVIAGRMDREGVAFLGRKLLARDAACTEDTIKTVLRKLRRKQREEDPLVLLSLPGETKGIRHLCYRFTLVRNPVAYAEGRTRKRAEEVQRSLRELTRGAEEKHRKQKTEDLRRRQEDAVLMKRAADGKLPLQEVEDLRAEGRIPEGFARLLRQEIRRRL